MKLKQSIFLVILFFSTSKFIAQTNESLCQLEINDISHVNSFGYLVGYKIQFKNNSNRVVNGIWWTASFYNNDNELIDENESAFNADNIIDPIASGFTKTIARAPRIKGASKVVIVLKKVTFTNGEKCEF